MLAEQARIIEKVYTNILTTMQNQSDLVEKMVNLSYLNERTKRNYWQSYQGRLKKLMEV